MHFNQSQRGFTLIEMIVSLGIFSVVMTIAVGSLLVLISNNQKLQGAQSVMTNLAFALDGMTREIRTGTNYFCGGTNIVTGVVSPSGYQIFDESVDEHEALGMQMHDCSTGGTERYRGISFIEGGDSITGATDTRILYYFASSTTEKTLKRRVGDGTSQSILASGLEVIDAQFIVSGTDTVGDNEQPTVTIFIEAKETNDDKIYRLQTTVTQRILDL